MFKQLGKLNMINEFLQHDYFLENLISYAHCINFITYTLYFL